MIINKKKIPLNIKILILISLILLLFFVIKNTQRQVINEFKYFNTGLSKSSNFNKNKIAKIILNPFFTNLDLLEINLNFKSLKKIEKNRIESILSGINDDPDYVNATLKFRGNIYQADISLKGDLSDHWENHRQMSLKIKLNDGFIYGKKKFSIHKIQARQYPSNDIFSNLVKKIGNLSNDINYIRVKFNGQNWGIMNLESSVDKFFLEKNRKKEGLTLKFDAQDEWAYRIKSKKEDQYVRSYKSYDILFDTRIINKSNFNENDKKLLTYILNKIRNDNRNLFDDNILCENIILSELWNTIHAIANSNSRYYLNPYTLKLEPILSDQAAISVYKKNINRFKFYQRNEVYGSIFKKDKKEFKNCLNNALNSVLKQTKEINEITKDISKIFPNDPKINTNIILDNFNYLKNNKENLITFNYIPYEEKIDPVLNISEKKLSFMSELLSIRQFSNGEIWLLNRLPITITIVEISNKNEIKRFSKKESIILPQSKLIEGYDTNKFISKPKIIQTGFTNKMLPIKVTFKVQKFKKDIFSDEVLIFDETVFNPLDFDSSNELISQNGIKKKDDDCFVDKNVEIYIKSSLVLNCNLTINSGAKIFIDQSKSLIIKGSLKLFGKKKSPIEFLSLDPSKYWGGIYVIGDQKKSLIQNVKLSNIKEFSTGLLQLTGAINFYKSDLYAENLYIKNVKAEDAINIIESSFILKNLNIKDTFSDAIDLDFSSGKIVSSSFKNIDGDAIDTSGTILELEKIDIENILDKGFSVGENSIVNGKEIFINNTGVGIAVKDGSKATLFEPTITNSKLFDIMTYIKKPMYKNPIAKIYSNKNKINYSYSRSKNTKLFINDRLTKKNNIDIDDLYQNSFMKKRINVKN